jgi:pimeloyl-ACP methyl ester carboxylesterase
VLNGWSASGLIWPDAWLERLERSFRLLLVDNRGTGYSARVDAPFTIDDLAADAAGVLDDAGVDAAHVFGLSMGGMIAQAFALAYPQRVRRLVLCSTTPGIRAGVSASAATIAQITAAPAGASRRELVERIWPILAAPGFPEREPAVIAALVGRVLEKPTALAVIALQLRAITGFDPSARHGGIRAPTLVLHGDADPLIPYENGRILARRIQGARLVTFPGVGHLLPYEAGERCAEVVEEFLSDASGPTRGSRAS